MQPSGGGGGGARLAKQLPMGPLVGAVVISSVASRLLLVAARLPPQGLRLRRRLVRVWRGGGGGVGAALLLLHAARHGAV